MDNKTKSSILDENWPNDFLSKFSYELFQWWWCELNQSMLSDISKTGPTLLPKSCFILFSKKCFLELWLEMLSSKQQELVNIWTSILWWWVNWARSSANIYCKLQLCILPFINIECSPPTDTLYQVWPTCPESLRPRSQTDWLTAMYVMSCACLYCKWIVFCQQYWQSSRHLYRCQSTLCRLCYKLQFIPSIANLYGACCC